MAQNQSSHQARREAVQPSLWDRLVDDLPGLRVESEHRRRDLAAELGEERLRGLLEGGPRAAEQDAALDNRQRRDLHILQTMNARLTALEERGIVVTADVLREAVRRDMEELFSQERLQARFVFSDSERGTQADTEDEIADFPHVRRSVLNYGVPSFSGRRAKDFDAEVLARELREIVAVFEPRLKRETVRVIVDTGDRTGLKIRVEGQLMLAPVPERLRLSTTIDLDNGRAATRIEEV